MREGFKLYNFVGIFHLLGWGWVAEYINIAIKSLEFDFDINIDLNTPTTTNQPQHKCNVSPQKCHINIS